MRISRAEALWLLRWATAAVVFSSVPYALGYVWRPPGADFLGLVPYAADGHSYLAKMLQGAAGEWLYHLAFTPEEHSGAFVFAFYLVLGRLAGGLGVPMAAALHLARLGFGLGMLVAAYAAIARFTDKLVLRRVAFLLASFSGGTGWLFFMMGSGQWLGEIPVDVHFPDATTYWTLYTFPNYAVSLTLVLLMFLWMLESFARHSPWHAVAAGFAGVALAITHPSILVVYAVLGAYLLFLWWAQRRFPLREVFYAALMVLISAPAVAYEYAVTVANWAFRVWNEQNYCYSPLPLNFLLSFGLPLALALVGARHIWRKGQRTSLVRWRGNTEAMVPVLWGLSVPVLIYAPTSVQRRLLEGWHVALSFLVAVALVGWLVPRLGRGMGTPAGQRAARRARLLNVLIILSIPSTILITAVGVALVLRWESHLYLYQDEAAALSWLRGNAASQEVVLAGMRMGNIIPGQTGNRVVIGHWSETLYAERKAREVEAFFQATTPDVERTSLLERYQVRYLWYGSEERRLGGFDPASSAYLLPVLQRPEVALYRVLLP